MKKQLLLAACVLSAVSLEAVISRGGPKAAAAPAPTYTKPAGAGAGAGAQGAAAPITSAAQLVAAYPANAGDIAQAAIDAAKPLANGASGTPAYLAAMNYFGS
jgi:hypothetical protein